MISLIVILSALLPFVAQDVSDHKLKVEAQVDSCYYHIDSIVYFNGIGYAGFPLDTLILLPCEDRK